jgi:hypothetical protein
MGGSPCAGKSSIARLLTNRHELSIYHCDEALAEQLQEIDPDRQPALYRWTTSSWNELWMQPVETLLSEAISCYREHFQIVVADLLSRPGSEPTLVEGNCLLPDDVHGLLSPREQAIWVVTSGEFVRTHYPNRGSWVQDILGECAAPEQALQNWMDREVLFAAWVAERAIRLGMSLLLVDGSQTIAAVADQVEAHYGLLPA